jgi:2,4-dienoyl-CoA reductase-like NADH-dependent reductase (Old Yellow Enzyme family)
MSESVQPESDSVQKIQEALQARGLELPMSEDFSVLGEPLALGAKTARNRLLVHPLEGCDCTNEGTPTDSTVRRYQRLGGGGAGVIWFEACAVTPESRSSAYQMMLTRENVGECRRLVEECRAAAKASMGADHAPLLIIQLTHSGWHSHPVPALVRPRPEVNQHLGLEEDYPLLTDEELDRLQENFVASALLAREAGFDGVELKACHGYMVGDLLGAFGRENSRYGGEAYENRTRFIREVHARVVEDVPDLLVTVRLDAYSAHPYPYGWGVSRTDPERLDLAEPLRLAGELKKQGAPIVSMTCGRPLPESKGIGTEEPSRVVLDLARGARMIHVVRNLQEAYPNLPLVGRGYSDFREFFPWFAAGAVQAGWAAMVGVGRLALAYPDFARDLLRDGRLDPERVCIGCYGCGHLLMQRQPVGCVVRDAEFYGPRVNQRRPRLPREDGRKKTPWGVL